MHTHVFCVCRNCTTARQKLQLCSRQWVEGCLSIGTSASVCWVFVKIMELCYYLRLCRCAHDGDVTLRATSQLSSLQVRDRKLACASQENARTVYAFVPVAKFLLATLWKHAAKKASQNKKHSSMKLMSRLKMLSAIHAAHAMEGYSAVLLVQDSFVRVFLRTEENQVFQRVWKAVVGQALGGKYDEGVDERPFHLRKLQSWRIGKKISPTDVECHHAIFAGTSHANATTTQCMVYCEELNFRQWTATCILLPERTWFAGPWPWTCSVESVHGRHRRRILSPNLREEIKTSSYFWNMPSIFLENRQMVRYAYKRHSDGLVVPKSTFSGHFWEFGVLSRVLRATLPRKFGRTVKERLI